MSSKKRFCIVIPSYKNAKWCEKNMASAMSQNYPDFRIIFTDDCSPDNTAAKVENFVKKQNKQSLVEIRKNSKRLGALHNLYDMIHSCEDDEIVVTLDGDDWFPHPNVLRKLASIYNGDKVWMTYGQYKSHPDGRIGCSRQIPQNIIDTAGYRKFRWCSSHLRTFYAWLFKAIKKEDLMRDGQFYVSGWDLPMMLSMLEMSGNHHRFVKDILYIYNYENPINDAKVDIKMQQGYEMYARSQPPYPRLIDADAKHIK